MDIHEILSEARRLVNSHLQCKVKSSLLGKLNSLSNKLDDSKLYLAVVGEFNAGKSTYINALLRQRILKEAVRPTTACALYIEKGGNEVTIKGEFRSNRKFKAMASDSHNLREYVEASYGIRCNNVYDLIEVLTSHQDVAKDVIKLQLFLPDANIPNNVVIIDTPGFNPGDITYGNHFDVTRIVVEEIADMALILMPSEQTMSASIMEFMRSSLSQYLHRCQFVITKGDNLEPHERGIVSDFLRQQLSSTFGLVSPKIYIESAISVLPVVTIPQSKKAEWNLWKQKFIQFETYVWKTLFVKKDIIIAEHTHKILANLLIELRKNLQERQNELRKERLALEGSRLERVEVVTQKIVNEAKSEIQSKISKLKRDIDTKITALRLICISKSNDIINSADDGMYNFETKEKIQIENSIKDKSRTLVTEINSKLILSLREDIRTIVKNLKKEFESHYSMFPALQCKVQIKDINVYDISISSLSFSASSYIEEKEDEEEQAAGIGAIVGGFVGFLIGGPGGAIIGAGIGGAGGAAAGNTIEEKKAGVKDILRKDISEYFNRVESQIKSIIGSQEDAIKKELKKFGSDHVSTYGENVDKIIAKHKQLLSSLSKQISGLERGVEYLEDSEDKVNLKLIELKHK